MSSPYRIPLSDLDYGPAEEQAVLRVLRSKWLTMGDETRAFESAFARTLGAQHALAVTNGTAALHLSMLALGVDESSFVIQPAVNFIASVNLTRWIKARAVLADICSLEEPTLDPASVEACLKKIPSSARTMVVAMHYGGYACRMDDLRDLCKHYGAVLMEDACHGVGGRCGQRFLGTVGATGCFSFFSNKNLVTGEGGMVVTDDDKVAEKIRRLRCHGMTSLSTERYRGRAYTYDIAVPGLNYRIDEMRAALGCVQLDKLDANNALRRGLVRRYWQALAPLTSMGWILPFSHMEGACDASACHLMPLVAPDGETRRRVVDRLKEQEIQTSLHYPFIPGFSAFQDMFMDADCPRAEQFCSRIITLPLYPTLSSDEVGEICAILKETARE